MNYNILLNLQNKNKNIFNNFKLCGINLYALDNYIINRLFLQALYYKYLQTKRLSAVSLGS